MTRSYEAPVLTDYLDPRVRANIALAMSESMRGRLVEMTKILQDDSLDVTTADVVGRTVALAYLLHLNRQSREALANLDEILTSKVRELPEEIRLIAEQNRVDVCLGMGLPVSDDLERHYGQIDRRHVLGVTFGRPDAIVDAAAASLGGKNYDSLAIYNSLLFDAYKSFDWHRTRAAAEDMCRELLKVGQPVQAAFCAVLSESKDAAYLVADHLRALNDQSMLDSVLEKVTETAHLSQHISLTCHLLERLSDAIPDRLVAIWLDRLRAARQLPGKEIAEDWAAQPAWKATAVLLQGATPRQAQQIIQEVLQHPRWSGNDIARDRFYEVLEAAAAVASESACRALAKAVIPHVIAKSPGHDFRSALHLLMTVGERWPALKSEIRGKLYRRGQALPHLLASAAPFFGKRVNFTAAKDAVKNAIEYLDHQVERVAAGAEPAIRHGESMLHTKTTPTGSIVVRIGSCFEELGVLTQYRKSLNRPLRLCLTDAKFGAR